MFAIGLQVLEEDALAGCPFFEHIEMRAGNVSVIPEGFFDYTTSLKVIKIDRNPIKKLPDNLFGRQPDMNTIFITGTQLEVLPLDELVGSTTRQYFGIFVYSNNLKDFQFEILADKYSGLKDLAFNDNEISCTRVQEILDDMERRIFTDNWLYSYNKTREQEVSSIDGNICIP